MRRPRSPRARCRPSSSSRRARSPVRTTSQTPARTMAIAPATSGAGAASAPMASTTIVRTRYRSPLLGGGALALDDLLAVVEPARHAHAVREARRGAVRAGLRQGHVLGGLLHPRGALVTGAGGAA